MDTEKTQGGKMDGTITKPDEQIIEVGDVLTQAQRKPWYEGLIRLCLWYPSDMLPEERSLVLRLDIFLLTWVCLSYFIKSIDQSCITNAYVSGMKEDLHLYGDEFNYFNSFFNAGYVIGMIPGTLMATRRHARLLLPFLEGIWAILSICQAFCKTPQQLYALRFILGIAEGPMFPTIIYILGSWYRKNEIYRRVMVFGVSASLGMMFSGYLQAAAFTMLSGKSGLAGWQWGMIIDGLISIPVAISGIWLFPGIPTQVSKLPWLCKDLLDLAKIRMSREGKEAPMALSFNIFKRVFTRWHIYFFSITWIVLNIAALPDGIGMQMWLKANPQIFSVPDMNNFPTIQVAIGIFATWILGGLADSISFFPILTLVQILLIISSSSLAVWDIPNWWRWICFMFVRFDQVDQTILSGWANHVCRHDAEERALVIAASDALSRAFLIWTNIVAFPVVSAPEFHVGYIVASCAGAVLLILPLWGYLGEREDERKLRDKLNVINDVQ